MEMWSADSSGSSVWIGRTRSTFVNDPPTAQIYTLSLRDALPISGDIRGRFQSPLPGSGARPVHGAHQPGADAGGQGEDRKSTRLNSSHSQISYAVFCLKKNK